MITTSHELSPEKLSDWLEPDFVLDQPVVGNYCLFDIYRHETRNAVCVVLRNEDDALTIEITPRGAAPGAACAADLDLSWQKPGPADAGLAACRRIAARIATSAGSEPRSWHLPAPADARIPRTLADEIQIEPAAFDDDPDAAALALDARHYARLYRVRPRAVRVRGPSGEPGLSVHYPRPRNRFATSSMIYAAPMRWVARRVFREYLAALGCAFENGEARIVPTPTTFAAQRKALALHGAPLEIELRVGRIGFVMSEPWIRRLIHDDTLVVRVAPRWAVELHGLIRKGPIDVGVLAHDVSLHALAFHAIPHAAWRELTELAKERLRARRRASRIARFFEEEVTKACWSVWRTIERPNDFGIGFGPIFDELMLELEEL